MRTAIHTANAYIDGTGVERVELRIDTERIDVSSDRATKPDPQWTFSDAAGHFHAWASDGKLPTLEPYQVPCDGMCRDPEHTITVYRCRICKASVEPAVVSDAGPRSMAGRTSYSVTVFGGQLRDIGDEVSVRIVTGHREVFGVGRIAGGEYVSGGRPSRTEIVLSDVGVRQVTP